MSIGSSFQMLGAVTFAHIYGLKDRSHERLVSHDKAQLNCVCVHTSNVSKHCKATY